MSNFVPKNCPGLSLNSKVSYSAVCIHCGFHGTYIRWYFKTRCAHAKENRNLLKDNLRSVTAVDLSKCLTDCSDGRSKAVEFVHLI